MRSVLVIRVATAVAYYGLWLPLRLPLPLQRPPPLSQQ